MLRPCFTFQVIQVKKETSQTWKELTSCVTAASCFHSDELSWEISYIIPHILSKLGNTCLELRVTVTIYGNIWEAANKNVYRTWALHRLLIKVSAINVMAGTFLQLVSLFKNFRIASIKCRYSYFEIYSSKR